MQPRSVEERVTMLEQQMQETRELPERVTALESQIQQLRHDMRDEFSAIRREMKTADDETRVFMRVLHEDALARTRVMGEGDDGSREDR